MCHLCSTTWTGRGSVIPLCRKLQKTLLIFRSELLDHRQQPFSVNKRDSKFWVTLRRLLSQLPEQSRATLIAEIGRDWIGVWLPILNEPADEAG